MHIVGLRQISILISVEDRSTRDHTIASEYPAEDCKRRPRYMRTSSHGGSQENMVGRNSQLQILRGC